MKWLRWDDGRQLSGYSKMLLATSKLMKFDCYLIRIPVGCGVPEHTDPAVPGYEHHRVNIEIKRPAIGFGKFHIAGPAKRFWNGRGVRFRPDLYAHSLTPVDFIWSTSSMYLFSFGWLRKENMSLPGTRKSATIIDTANVISWTNRAQAIVLSLANDELIPLAARDLYEEANDKMKKAMTALIEATRK